MLSVRNVTKKYGKTAALTDVSFDAASGQIVLIVGGSGAGKSALLDCIAGISAFDGSISVGGFGCRSFQARRIVGYVRDPFLPPSDRLIYDKLSPDEHISFIRRAYALDGDGVKYAASLFTSFGLDQYRSCPACELPSTVRRRLEIVMALALRPGLLLLDRPALGLDKNFADELCACLLALKLRGTAVVIAVSDVSEIGAVWDNAFELRGGRIVSTFSSALHAEPAAAVSNVDKSPAAPIADKTAAVPSADKTAAAPIADKTAAAPIADKSPAAPIADKTAAVPSADKTAAAPITDKTTAMPGAVDVPVSDGSADADTAGGVSDAVDDTAGADGEVPNVAVDDTAGADGEVPNVAVDDTAGADGEVPHETEVPDGADTADGAEKTEAVI